MTRTPRERTERPGKPAVRIGRAGKRCRPADRRPLIISRRRAAARRPDALHRRQSATRPRSGRFAKAFGLKGDNARSNSRRCCATSNRTGLLEKKRKSLVRPGALPPVTVLDITTRDKDGELIGRPAEWPEDAGVAPAVAIRQSRRRRQAQGQDAGRRPRRPRAGKDFPGQGPRRTGLYGPHHQGPRQAPQRQRSTRRLPRRARTAAAAASCRSKSAARNCMSMPSMPGRRQGRRSGRSRNRASRAASACRAPRCKSVIGSVASEKAISMIAIHAHGIPYIFPDRRHQAKPTPPAPRPCRIARTGATLPLITIDPADAKDHDDAVHAEPDPSPDNPGGVIVTVAIADVSYYVRPKSALDQEALKRGNSVYFPDRVVPMLPERISNELCSLKEGVDRPALAVRMRLLEGRPQGRPYVPSHHDEERRQALLQPGAGGDRRQARRQDRAAAGADPEAAVGRPTRSLTRGRDTAPAARTQHARAQDHPEAGRHRRPGLRAATGSTRTS